MHPDPEPQRAALEGDQVGTEWGADWLANRYQSVDVDEVLIGGPEDPESCEACQ